MLWVGRNLWELRLSQAWSAREDEECLTLTKPDGGAFQLSAATKIQGMISLEELRALYGPQVPIGGSFDEYSAGDFRGFTSSFLEDGTLWRKFWLACGNLLVFATYNGTDTAWDSDKKEVHEMLRSLRVQSQPGELPS